MKAQQCGSLPILIGRGLDLRRERENAKSFEVNFSCAVFKARKKRRKGKHPEPQADREPKVKTRAIADANATVKAKANARGTQTADLESRIEFPVTIARGKHLYPSRTQKLRLSAPMVLGWKRPGRVGRRRIPKIPRRKRIGIYIPQ